MARLNSPLKVSSSAASRIRRSRTTRSGSSAAIFFRACSRRAKWSGANPRRDGLVMAIPHWGRTPTTWQTRRVTHVGPVGMPDHMLELVCCHVMLRNVIDVFVHPPEFGVRHCGSLCPKFRFLNGATNPPFRCESSSVATKGLAVTYFSQQVGRNAIYYTACPRRSQCRARLGLETRAPCHVESAARGDNAPRSLHPLWLISAECAA